jgi:hypothetical protein
MTISPLIDHVGNVALPATHSGIHNITVKHASWAPAVTPLIVHCDWRNAEIERAIRTDVARDGRKLRLPIQWAAYFGIKLDEGAYCLSVLANVGCRGCPAV